MLEKPKAPEKIRGKRWNQKIYGKSKNFSIYLDSVKTMVTDDEAKELEKYLIEKAEYNEKIQVLKKKYQII